MPQRLKPLNNNKLEGSIRAEVPNYIRNREGSFIFLPLLVRTPVPFNPLSFWPIESTVASASYATPTAGWSDLGGSSS